MPCFPRPSGASTSSRRSSGRPRRPAPLAEGRGSSASAGTTSAGGAPGSDASAARPPGGSGGTPFSGSVWFRRAAATSAPGPTWTIARVFAASDRATSRRIVSTSQCIALGYRRIRSSSRSSRATSFVASSSIAWRRPSIVARISSSRSFWRSSARACCSCSSARWRVASRRASREATNSRGGITWVSTTRTTSSRTARATPRSPRAAASRPPRRGRGSRRSPSRGRAGGPPPGRSPGRSGRSPGPRS